MKIFHSMQIKLARLGFTRIERDQCHPHPFNEIHLKRTLLSISSCVSMFLFILYRAGNPRSYMDSLYFFTAAISLEVSRSNYIFKTAELFNSIDNLEKVTNESKWSNFEFIKLFLSSFESSQEYIRAILCYFKVPKIHHQEKYIKKLIFSWKNWIKLSILLWWLLVVQVFYCQKSS